MSFLNLEPYLVERLGLVNDLIVQATADVSEASMGTLGTTPTAVVAFQGAEVQDSKARALLTSQDWAVFYIRRGPIAARDPVDGQHIEQIIKLLHGWTPDEDLFDPLQFEGAVTDYRDNARQYLLTFTVQAVLPL